MDERFEVGFEHRVRFVHDALDPIDPTLADLIHDSARPVLPVLDAGLLDANVAISDRLRAYAEAHGLAITPPCSMPGGETAKNDEPVWRSCLERIHDAGLCRRSVLLVSGGGAVLDAAGFAASLAHRGVRTVRVPSTTLAQCDSGVGVKNGVNAFGKKNYLGVFDPPWGVVNDTSLLKTLSDRDWRAGFSECVKVGLVKDAAFFERIERDAKAIAARDLSAAAPIIERSAEIHLQHITRGGDPFERTRARPLDFGHWSAHKLEQMTGYELRHGEAVALGVALDTLYSMHAGMLNRDDADRVIAVLRDLGFTLWHEQLRDLDTLFAGLGEFREHLGGELAVPLLRAVGDSVDADELDPDLIRAAADTLAG